MHKHFLHSSFDLGNTWIFARSHRNKHCTEFFRDHIVLLNPWWHICDSGDDSDTFYQHYPQVFLFDTLWSHLICVVTENPFLWKTDYFFNLLVYLTPTTVIQNILNILIRVRRRQNVVDHWFDHIEGLCVGSTLHFDLSWSAHVSHQGIGRIWIIVVYFCFIFWFRGIVCSV